MEKYDSVPPAEPKTGSDAYLDITQPKTISAELLARLLEEDHHNVLLIDCRYPYEYDGGHIVGAKNLYEVKDLRVEFFNGNIPCALNKMIVFYCEFSILRGPALLRSLREQDREVNAASYPSLCYPDLYMLEGGYRAFWLYCRYAQKDLCDPLSYTPMKDKRYAESLKKYSSHKKTQKRKRPEDSTPKKSKKKLAF